MRAFQHPGYSENYATFSDPLIPLAKGRKDFYTSGTKKEFSNSVIKAIDVGTMNNRYPHPDWLHVYTDELRLDQDGSAGSGIFSGLFACYLNLGPNTTLFDGEVEANKMINQG
ncbi:hypothetical protein TNIN_340941 [Trichonephila inaurata madagascariensis]|uniref:Uncharacterized protein n=1 Tax=Trichonephila inaurata madagascariensis TaxID=2747483 RepID=A0A8X6YPL7_9ARAC|nr:hypothetical protein TNIN_340941 [Trichonephila inaurata madagascariensis]